MPSEVRHSIDGPNLLTSHVTRSLIGWRVSTIVNGPGVHHRETTWHLTERSATRAAFLFHDYLI